MQQKKILFVVCYMTTFLTACVDDFKVGNAFLDKVPGVDVTKDSIFNKAEYARRFLWNTYSGLYYALPGDWSKVKNKMNLEMFETLSDSWHSHLSWGGVNTLYYSGTYSAADEDDSEKNGMTRFSFNNEGVWETIRKAWIFIENVDRVPDMDNDEKKRLIAEAKVIIASRYFDAYRHLGGLPLLKKSMNVNDDIQNERATVEATNDFMISLLDEAIPDLPWVLSPDEYKNWDGRMTSAGAMGLKCKILLFTASPLFNCAEPYCTEAPQDAVTKKQVWVGQYKAELWDRCKTACEEFFAKVQSQGHYGLLQASGTSLDDYRKAYRNAYYSRGAGYENPEMLISTRYIYNYWNYDDGYYLFPNSCLWGAVTPTQEYVEMFPMADGEPFDWNNSNHRERMFKDRDPRMYETISFNQCPYQNRELEAWIGGREAKKNALIEGFEFATGYACHKFILDHSSAVYRPQLWPYLRMAEVHLIYAESLMKTGNLDKAIDEVDKVRARVGLKSLRNFHGSDYLNNPENLMDEILRERACELGLEDVRFFDMIRNKMKENFTTHLHGLRIYRNDCFTKATQPGGDRFSKDADGNYYRDKNGEYVYNLKSWSNLPEATRGPKPTSFSYEKFELINRTRYLWKEGNFSSKWYLTAFPPAEVNKQYGLTQNPGWN